MSDKAFLRVQSALEKASGHSVEHHLTSFGRIIAVRAGEGGLVGIAIDGRWPHAVLEVDWIDREQRTTEPLSLRLPSSALSPEKLADVYREARSLKLDGKLRVDNGTA